ncbi:MAG: carotenoid 1,2-hydratase [Parvularculaceae bacterium]
MDALSDDGAFGLTMIAFVGSVFSPYYASRGRRDPDDHCALNVALYGPRAARWAMTERGRSAVRRDATSYDIARSRLALDGNGLTISVDERTAPFPSPFPQPLVGEIRVRFDGLGDGVFFLDDAGRHRWRPLAPFSRVEVDFRDPALKWSGHGYFDANDGDEPLEDRFAYWDWSRAILGEKRTAILYNCDLKGGLSRSAALLVTRNGDVRDFDIPAPRALPPTPVWRIKRRTRADADDARVVRTLEDTPFYSRSVIESSIFGDTRCAVHESLSGPRLGMRIVKGMLPFRMPREA